MKTGAAPGNGQSVVPAAREALAVTEGETDAGNHETEPVKNSS